LEIISIVNDEKNDLRRKYNLSDLNISPKNVYVVPHDNWWPKELEDGGGYFSPQGQFMVVREAGAKQIRKSRLFFANKVFHEMLEFKFYNALRKYKNSSSTDVHRIGLRFYEEGREKSLLGNLSEAIVEELTITLLNKLRDNPLFKKEFEISDKIKEYLADKKTVEGNPLLNGDEYYVTFDKNDSTLWKAQAERVQERKILNKLIERIYQRNNDRFKNEREVFDVFVKAAITGRIIRLGRLIDKTLGKGAFKQITGLEDDIDKQEEFVDSI